ncbi:MAG: hypothetical protein IV100_13345 [Myxococcales bacterium]|nr:hypothetical protein [Myxococcales bacterium]
MKRGFFGQVDGDNFTLDHEARLRFALRAQAEHQLPLDVVQRIVVDDCDGDLEEAEAALMVLVEPDPTRAGPGPSSTAALIARASADPNLIARLARIQAIPSQGPYGGHHVWIVESSRELLDLGVTAPELERAVGLALSVGAVEVDALLGTVGRGVLPRAALADARARRDAVGQVLASARSAAATERLSRVARAADGSRELTGVATHVPSTLFRARHRLDGLLSRTRAAFLESGDPLVGRDLAKLLIGLGEFQDAARVAEVCVGAESAPPDLGLYLGLCRSMAGDDVGAIRAIERSAGAVNGVLASAAGQRAPDGNTAVLDPPHDPRTFPFLAAAQLVAAGRAGDLLAATSHIEHALAALAASRRVDDGTRPITGGGGAILNGLESRLVRGRISLVMPDVFGLSAAGEADLRSILDATDHGADDTLGFEVPGSRDLLRISAAFFLGVWLDEREQSSLHASGALPPRPGGLPNDVDALLREVVALDPMSDFAAAAYRRLARRSTTARGQEGRL